MLYSADTPAVRELNERYGPESDPRGGSIKSRSENWDRIEPHLEDAMAWEALSEEERARAINQLKSEVPAGREVNIEPIYSAESPIFDVGADSSEPGYGAVRPSPRPGPPPTPPGGS
ncbi:hypothetical protein GCM10010420_24340 [Streptomyces glaucosporus]|uniref:Uncharacterized protein n=1 Tax=Streptomyces glaucosporus TaxID=284044 RepID=A0ABN3I8E6_9ACTN